MQVNALDRFYEEGMSPVIYCQPLALNKSVKPNQSTQALLGQASHKPRHGWITHDPSFLRSSIHVMFILRQMLCV